MHFVWRRVRLEKSAGQRWLMRSIEKQQTREQAKAHLNRSFHAGVAIQFLLSTRSALRWRDEQPFTSTVDLLARYPYLRLSECRPANKKGGRIARPPFRWLGWLRLLEVNPCPNFHLTGGENRTGDSPKVR